jgi:hypothetical protein
VSERERGGEVGRCGVGGPEGRVGWAASAGTGKRRGKRGSGVLSFFLVFFFKTISQTLNSNSFQNTSSLFQNFENNLKTFKTSHKQTKNHAFKL